MLYSPTTEYYIEEAIQLSVLSRRRWSVVKRSLDDAPPQLICLPIVYTRKSVHDNDNHKLSASFIFRLGNDLTNFFCAKVIKLFLSTKRYSASNSIYFFL